MAFATTEEDHSICCPVTNKVFSTIILEIIRRRTFKIIKRHKSRQYPFGVAVHEYVYMYHGIIILNLLR